MTGNIQKRGKHSWRLKFDIGKDATGKRVFEFVTVTGKRAEAEAELAKRLTALNSGAYVENSKISVRDFFDKWITTYAEGNVSAKTLEGYKSIIEHHFKPAFGSLPLQKLSPLQIQTHYASVLKEGGRKDGRKGALNPRTVLHQHRLLSEAMEMAVRWQLLVRNPCDAVTPPNVVTKEVEAIDEDATAWLIIAAAGTRLYLPILMTTCGGLRRGEVLAATWSNLDRERSILHITRAISEPKKNVILFKEPKSKRTRKIAIPTLLMEALLAHRKEQEKTREALGAAFQNNDLICCAPDGSIWKPSAFTSSYCALLKRRKLTGPNFHALRHSHASQMLADGVDLKTVSVRLGHSKASFTLTQYCHMLPGQDGEAARRVDTVLRKALEKAQPTKVM